MSATIRHLLLACGWLSLALGTIGLVLPVMPTTPFVLLAAACFLRSSTRLHTWLVGHPVFGKHIADYLAGRGLGPRTKVIAIATLWGSIALSIWLVEIIWVEVLLVSIAVAVSVYLLRLPTAR